MKCYVVIENRDGILDSVVVYKNFDDAKAYFDGCVEPDFFEINAEPGNEFMYAQDNPDDDYDIAIYPTEIK